MFKHIGWYLFSVWHCHLVPLFLAGNYSLLFLFPQFYFGHPAFASSLATGQYKWQTFTMYKSSVTQPGRNNFVCIICINELFINLWLMTVLYTCTHKVQSHFSSAFAFKMKQTTAVYMELLRVRPTLKTPVLCNRKEHRLGQPKLCTLHLSQC